MLNNVVLVGRVLIEPELTIYDTGVRCTKVYLSVFKPFRNDKNEYESDVIPVYVWYKMADVVCDYVGVGSIIGFKCRLGTHKYDVDGVKFNLVDVIAERISFIQLKPRSNKPEKEDKDEMIERVMTDNSVIDYDNDNLKGTSDSSLFFTDDLGTNYKDGVDLDEEKSSTKSKKKATK